MRKFRGVRIQFGHSDGREFYRCDAQQYHLSSSNQLYHCPTASFSISRTLRAYSLCALYNFWLSALLFAGIALISMSRYRSQTSRWSIFDQWNILEILLMLLLMWVQNVAYNGLILLVLRISSMVPKS